MLHLLPPIAAFLDLPSEQAVAVAVGKQAAMVDSHLEADNLVMVGIPVMEGTPEVVGGTPVGVGTLEVGTLVGVGSPGVGTPVVGDPQQKVGHLRVPCVKLSVNDRPF